VCLSVI